MDDLDDLTLKEKLQLAELLEGKSPTIISLINKYCNNSIDTRIIILNYSKQLVRNNSEEKLNQMKSSGSPLLIENLKQYLINL